MIDACAGRCQRRAQVAAGADGRRQENNAIDAPGRQRFRGGQDDRAARALAEQVNPAIRIGVSIREHGGGELSALREMVLTIGLVGYEAFISGGPGECLDLYRRPCFGDDIG